MKANCKRCDDYGQGGSSKCSMKCSKKGPEKQYPKKKWGMEQIKKCLENNIGCYISIANISHYSKEIKRYLK